MLIALEIMVSVHTSQRTQSVCITNTNLMLYGELNAVCCEFHTNTHIDSVRGNAKLWYVKPGGTYCYHYVSKD
jgi:hypothetical protein